MIMFNAVKIVEKYYRKTQLYIEYDMRPWQRLNLPFIAVNNCEQVALFTLPADAEGFVLGQHI